MSAETPDSRPRGRALARPRPLLLGFALACLAAALAVLLLHGGSGAPGSQRAGGCSGRGAPQVVLMAPTRLGPLRAAVARVLPERVGRLYEEGTIVGGDVFSDGAPSGPAVDPAQRRPGGYEMRWWAPNGDDLVADVLVFASPQIAAQFLELASASRCGQSLPAGAAGRPPLARNLAWTNPDNAAEADVLLARGSRVYRVADAPAGQVPGRTPDLSRALRTVDSLACLLPDAHCSSVSHSVPA